MRVARKLETNRHSCKCNRRQALKTHTNMVKESETCTSVPYLPTRLRESPSTDPDKRDFFKAFVVAKLPSVSVQLRSARLSEPLLVGCALLHYGHYVWSTRWCIGQVPFGSSWPITVQPAVILVAFSEGPDEPSGADNLLFVSPTCAK